LAVVPLVIWFGFVAVVQGSAIRIQLATLALNHLDPTVLLNVVAKLGILLFSMTVVGLLFMRLPPKNGAQGVLPRLVAIVGTYLSVTVPFVLHPTNVPPAVLALSTAMILGGTVFAIHAVLHLGRSFSVMPEARRLVTTGPYAWVRHPLYVGEEIAVFGVILQYISPAALAILLCQMACQLYRMKREEAVLAETFPAYNDYKAKTARLLPGIY
jgi:protein-S-isoprenylcysteine O-methyltransferase Ste14